MNVQFPDSFITAFSAHRESQGALRFYEMLRLTSPRWLRATLPEVLDTFVEQGYSKSTGRNNFKNFLKVQNLFGHNIQLGTVQQGTIYGFSWKMTIDPIIRDKSSSRYRLISVDLKSWDLSALRKAFAKEGWTGGSSNPYRKRLSRKTQSRMGGNVCRQTLINWEKEFVQDGDVVVGNSYLITDQFTDTYVFRKSSKDYSYGTERKPIRPETEDHINTDRSRIADSAYLKQDTLYQKQIWNNTTPPINLGRVLYGGNVDILNKILPNGDPVYLRRMSLTDEQYWSRKMASYARA